MTTRFVANERPRRGAALPRLLALLVLSPVIVTCDTERVMGGGEPIGYSKAYGVWKPTSLDTCPASVHDAYSVVGPDQLVYPTWHPPVDPATGCTFGHEHGRDPRGSDLYDDTGPIPFGYANQVLDTFDPSGMRHEDHVGHKIEWENNFKLDFEDGAAAVLDITCDVLVKMHQGSHSKDAFTNNLHEVAYHFKCNDGTEMHITAMAAIGTPGEMVASCDGRHIRVGAPTPANSPEGGGQRKIPDRACVERFMFARAGERANIDAALHESWEIHPVIRRADGRTLASFDPYFQLEAPSRFFDPAKPNVTGRPIEVCYEVRADGARPNGSECERATANGAIQGMTFDDPRSPFNGVERFVDINGNRVSNADGPTIWYTDPFGRGARREPFPGSIRQFIARVDNSGRQGHGPVIGHGRNYGAPSVHAPN
jgi:hypothetical protein